MKRCLRTETQNMTKYINTIYSVQRRLWSDRAAPDVSSKLLLSRKYLSDRKLRLRNKLFTTWWWVQAAECNKTNKHSFMFQIRKKTQELIRNKRAITLKYKTIHQTSWNQNCRNWRRTELQMFWCFWGHSWLRSPVRVKNNNNV